MSNWHNKNSKLCFLKQQIFRCLLDPCAANNPRKVGEEHTHVTPLIASSTIVAIIIYLVFIEKWNHRCFLVFFNFSYKNEKRKKCTVFHFFPENEIRKKKFEIQSKYSFNITKFTIYWCQIQKKVQYFKFCFSIYQGNEGAFCLDGYIV